MKRSGPQAESLPRSRVSTKSYQKHRTNTMTKTDKLKKLQGAIADFAEQRNWHQFHAPKNLAMALSVECSELVEIFQWLTGEQSYEADAPTLSQIREEIGDIMIYLTLIASKFDIDPLDAALDKMEINRRRYPCS